jgi:hypothetical protein
LARRLFLAFVVSFELRKLRRHIWLARSSNWSDDVDVDVCDHRALRSRTQFGNRTPNSDLITRRAIRNCTRKKTGRKWIAIRFRLLTTGCPITVSVWRARQRVPPSSRDGRSALYRHRHFQCIAGGAGKVPLRHARAKTSPSQSRSSQASPRSVN